MSVTPLKLNLTSFRRRIRLLRASRCAAMGGSIGAGVSVLLAIFDYVSWMVVTPWLLALPVMLGAILGIVKALTERMPDTAIAQSIDRRSHLEDRLTSAIEIPRLSDHLSSALHHDAIAHMDTLKPARLYPFRVSRWHGLLLGLAALSIGIFLFGNSPIFKSEQAKQEAAELKKAADEVERVSRPVLEEAKKAEATPEDKVLAHRLEQFSSELRRGRMTRQEALVKANDLADQAKKLETKRAASLSLTLASAQSAGAQLQKMDEKSKLEKSDAFKQAEKAHGLESQIAALEKKLAEAQSGVGKGKSALSKSEMAQMQKQLAQAKSQLQQIKLSQQAQATLAKLASMPEFQQAQELLAKLASNATAQQAGEQAQMTPEQMQAAAQKLEQLAKQLNTDAKMQAYAKALLEAAKQARAGKNGNGTCVGVLGAFGLGSGTKPGMGGLSLGGGHGAGGPSPDKWVGDHGTLNKSDKSSLLNVPFKDRVIASQIGNKGPQTYTEVLGPSTLGNKSAVPYQNVMPKYEKSAESALRKSDIPPQLRTKVRDYFDSLRK